MSDTRDLDCPQCGGPVPALRWHEPDEEWPEGDYLAREDDEHTCSDCGALCQVGVDDATAYLTLVHCRHGRAEDEPCWRCNACEAIAYRYRVARRKVREWWCGITRRHAWERMHWVPGQEHELCQRCGCSRWTLSSRRRVLPW